MAIPSFLITFDNNSGDNLGKIVLTVTNSSLNVTTRAWWEITDPLGNVIKSLGTPYNNPDVTAVGTDPATDTFDIPTNDDGAWIAGTYSFRIYYDENGDTGLATMSITGQDNGDVTVAVTPDISAIPFGTAPLLVEYNDGVGWQIAVPSGDDFIVQAQVGVTVPVRLTITADDGFLYLLLYDLLWVDEDNITLTFVSETVTAAEYILPVIEAYYYPNRTLSNSSSSVIDIALAVNCITGVITAADNTDNDGWNVDGSSVFALVPPATDGNPSPDDVEGTPGDTLTGYITWTYVTWQAVMNLIRDKDLFDEALSNGQHTVDVLVSHVETLTKLVNQEITCASDLCDITNCLAEKFDTINAKALKYGGWANVPETLVNSWSKAQGALDVFLAYMECGNVNAATPYLEIVKEELDCGCGCDNNTDPQPYTPPAAGNAVYSSILLESGTVAKKISAMSTMLGADVVPSEDYLVIVDTSLSVNKKILPDELAVALTGALTTLLLDTLQFQTPLEFFAESESAGASVWTAAGSGTNRPAVIEPKGTGALQLRTGGDARGANAIDLQTLAGAASQVASGAGSSVIGSNNTASGINAHAKGNTALAERRNEEAFGVGQSTLLRSVLTPYRRQMSGATAFLATLAGGATSDIALPSTNSGNWSAGCTLVVMASIINNGGGGFSAGDSFLGTRQFVIRSYGGVTQIEGLVEVIGTDVATASLSTLAIDVTANNALDTLEIEITPPAGMVGSNFMNVICRLEMLQIQLS